MSKNKKVKSWPLDVNYNQQNIGQVCIMQSASTGMYDDILANMVIAPAIQVMPDGSKKIVGWSLINGKSYRSPQNASKQ